MRALVTGSSGFIGRNAVTALSAAGIETAAFDIGDPPAALREGIDASEVILHLAGVNRPKDPEEFRAVNVDLTRVIARGLMESGRPSLVLFASSIQAELDNPYGNSKREAEEIFREAASINPNLRVAVFRLPNVFGKWCRPNYNSVVATFCWNAVHGEKLIVNDPGKRLTLAYIDDVIRHFKKAIDGRDAVFSGERFLYLPVEPVYDTTVSALAHAVTEIVRLQRAGFVPDFSDGLTRALYATALSYFPAENLLRRPERHEDHRGSLVELIKSFQSGQIFFSRSKPGVVRGNHYHHTKTEKFIVIDGEAVIRMRKIGESDLMEFPVSGEDIAVVDIPPGYTHSIENTGPRDLITLFWASEPFDPERPDTYPENVGALIS
jgi:UDP-2-acetamido-2,6-beta-L-arabino-hexul-4-ose reductase